MATMAKLRDEQAYQTLNESGEQTLVFLGDVYANPHHNHRAGDDDGLLDFADININKLGEIEDSDSGDWGDGDSCGGGCGGD